MFSRIRHTHSGDEDTRQAQWAIGVLRMALDVVGRESFVGQILSQTKRELESLANASQARLPGSRAA